MAVEIVLLLASLALRRRPQVNGVCGNLHINQSPRGGGHQYNAAQQHNEGMQHTEGTPDAEAGPQKVLKAFTQCFTARSID